MLWSLILPELIFLFMVNVGIDSFPVIQLFRHYFLNSFFSLLNCFSPFRKNQLTIHNFWSSLVLLLYMSILTPILLHVDRYQFIAKS
jgi:hypothetical protein